MVGGKRGVLLIGQSGGATAVTNATLIGALEAGLDTGSFSRIVGLRRGIEGLLENETVDLGSIDSDLRQRIRVTPSAALGTSRKRLTPELLPQALQQIRTLRASGLVLIGGNDSADTALRLHQAALETGIDAAVAVAPKTVDNDLMGTDFCPGFPSAARYLALAARDATWDSLAAPDLYPLKFIEIMGRDAGWLTAATSLAFTSDEEDILPLLCFPERSPSSPEALLEEIQARIRRRGFAVCVVPETLRDANGLHLGGEDPDDVDAFGHPYFPSATVALADRAARTLGIRARVERPGSAARMSMALASPVDLRVAYDAGREAALAVANGTGGIMITIARCAEGDSSFRTGEIPLEAVANRVRKLPDHFIGADQRSITSEFTSYALPLMGPDPFPHYDRLGPSSGPEDAK